MDLAALCRRIALPEEAIGPVLRCGEASIPEDALRPLTVPETAGDAYRACKALCRPEERGLDLLSLMLRAALMTYDNYQSQAIGDGIFFATMKCFSRFVGEHLDSFGTAGFDRGWWTCRQLSMRLFRVGELEYEFHTGEQTIYLHVPSDTKLRLPLCAASLDQFRRFAAEHYPAWAGWPMVIHSWLLSPALDKLLPPETNIRRFKSCFDLTGWDRTSTEFLQWVYGRSDIPYAQLPERTRLQRAMKAHLLGGGSAGSARGVLRGFGPLSEIGKSMEHFTIETSGKGAQE